MGNLESQRRQYDLARSAEAAGFRSVTVIDDDLGRSGSGNTERPGFERLVAMVCSGDIGAVYCIEASRLARNGRDWHHLIDLCALAGALVIDPDGAYDPRLVNDRLLLGLKGTMSEYELSLLRQRGIAARDSKAQRGEYRFMLPPGFCWSEIGKIEIDPDENVAGLIRLVFAKFRELGSARQVFLWLRAADIKMPVVLRNVEIYKLIWKAPAYHTVSTRFMLVPTRLAESPRKRVSWTAGPARSAGSGSRVRNGTSFCATIMPATSAGRNMRTIRSCCWKMPI
jgi:DNA invertase Pin-like site-specific DNA recombinase